MKEDLYVKMAYWYYTLGKTQDEIANKLGITRQRVNRIINSLEDMGIVSIHLHGLERNHVELECLLEEKYNLNEVIVADDYGEEASSFYKVVNVAAQYLNKVIKKGDVIGVSLGRTLSHIIREMEYRRDSDCKVVQLMGTQNLGNKIIKEDEVARGLANRLDCASYTLYAPILVEHPETKEWLLKERSIKQSFDLMTQCDIAILGVGDLSSDSTIYQRGIVSSAELEKLKKENFVGDICMNPIREDGSSDNCFLRKRIISADIECLKNIKNTVVVVNGMHKAKSIKAALGTGVVNTLIIDSTTARYLSKE